MASAQAEAVSFWQSRKVFVTGSEGLIGRPLIRMLHEKGALVYPYDKALGYDILDFDDLLKSIRACKPSIVIHLAALSNVGFCHEIPHETFRVLAMGTVNVLEACRLAKVDALVTASSNHVYGRQAAIGGTNEECKLNHLDAYAVSKICADYMARSYGEVYGVPTAIVRNTNCFGPDDPHSDHLVPSIINALLDGRSVDLRSDGSVAKAYLYVDDVATAYLMVAQHTAETRKGGEAYNVSGQVVTATQMANRIATLMGIPLNLRTGIMDPLQYDERLNDAKVRGIGWRPRYTLDGGLEKTIAGFKARRMIQHAPTDA